MPVRPVLEFQMCSIIPCQRILMTISNEFKSVHSQLCTGPGFKYEDSSYERTINTPREKK
jgi:hypothetical protein